MVDENDFCFVYLIGKIHSVARKWSFCCVFENVSADCILGGEVIYVLTEKVTYESN